MQSKAAGMGSGGLRPEFDVDDLAAASSGGDSALRPPRDPSGHFRNGEALQASKRDPEWSAPPAECAECGSAVEGVYTQAGLFGYPYPCCPPCMESHMRLETYFTGTCPLAVRSLYAREEP